MNIEALIDTLDPDFLPDEPYWDEKICHGCRVLLPASSFSPFRGEYRSDGLFCYCRKCASKAAYANLERHPSLRAKSNSRIRVRQAQKAQRYVRQLTPEQRDAIEQIYESRLPGQEVDHIVPLLGDNVCGLHVPWNLRVTSTRENRSKGNRFRGEFVAASVYP